jgi:site-specific DNA recombinase
MKLKKAAQYIRQSDADQSNFSPDAQDRLNQKWANRNNTEIVATFIDDGRSAKNFDRPDWKKLEIFLKKNARDIDTLIFIRYDRFSRNMLEALLKIEELEKKYNIFLEAALEPIGVPRSHPDFFKRRAQYLLDAEAVWHRIRDSTKMGIYEAHMQGRFVSKAPYGYINSRIPNPNKTVKGEKKEIPMLAIDPVKSVIVAQIFEDFLNGHSFEAILIKAKEKGFPGIANGTIQRILKNPVYAGLLRTIQYRDEPSMITKAVHPAIISEDKWWKVQEMMQPKNQFKTIISDEFPLRGKLICHECKKPMTGAQSKGKYQYFPYYKCNYHGGHNFNATRLNNQMTEVMQNLSLSDYQIEIIREEILKGLQADNKKSLQEVEALKKSADELRSKIEGIEEKYLGNKIDEEMFKKWHTKYKAELADVNDQIRALDTPEMDYEQMINSELNKLTDLKYIYSTAGPVEKQSLVTFVFDRQISYFNGMYRTPYITPLFSDKVLILKEKKLLEVEQLSQNYRMCTSREQNRTLELVELLTIIHRICA